MNHEKKMKIATDYMRTEMDLYESLRSGQTVVGEPEYMGVKVKISLMDLDPFFRNLILDASYLHCEILKKSLPKTKGE